VEKIKDNEEVDADDMKLALLTLDSILSQSISDTNDLYAENNVEKRKLIAERSIGNYKRARVTNPGVWLGDLNPSNPGYQKKRALIKAVAAKFIG
jgi:hypothetical protein